MSTVFLLKRPGLKVLPYLQVKDIIMDAGDLEALGDRLGFDCGGPIYRCQDTVELFMPLIREEVAKSAEGGLELGNRLLPGMAFHLHQEGGLGLWSQIWARLACRRNQARSGSRNHNSILGRTWGRAAGLWCHSSSRES